MKKLNSLLASALLVLPSAPITGTILTATALTACKSSQSAVAYKTISSVQASVEVSLSAWADYVVRRNAAIAKLPEPERSAESAKLIDREWKARNALTTYKSIASSAIVAIGSGSTAASPDLISAATKFIATTK